MLRSCEGEMRVPDISLKSVLYIGEATAQGIFNPRGTGFIAVVLRPSRTPIFYLVTADHVRRLLRNEKSFAIRLNDAEGKAQVLRSPTAFQWWRHPTDKSVDAAVYPWFLEDFPMAAFPTSRFVTEEQLKFNRFSDPGIGIGDEIFIVGLFNKMKGRNRITPILRHGHIAMMAGEPIPTKNYGHAEFYLVEDFSTAGLSGSPVYVNETVYFPYQQGSRPRAYPENADPAFRVAMAVGPTHCLGLLHGMMPIETAVELAGDPDHPKQKWHSGISMVVPATKLLEIINQPKLVEQVQRMEQAIKEDRPIETALLDEKEKGEQRTGRNIRIPEPTRARFFSDPEKATRKLAKK